jgi:hypothetical protein
MPVSRPSFLETFLIRHSVTTRHRESRQRTCAIARLARSIRRSRRGRIPLESIHQRQPRRLCARFLHVRSITYDLRHALTRLKLCRPLRRSVLAFVPNQVIPVDFIIDLILHVRFQLSII